MSANIAYLAVKTDHQLRSLRMNTACERSGGTVEHSIERLTVTNVVGFRPLHRQHQLQDAQLSLTNRAMLFCKVVQVLQDVLSENVDKKFITRVPNYYSAFDTIILLRFYNYILLYN